MAAVIFASKLAGNHKITQKLGYLGAESLEMEEVIIICLPHNTVEGVVDQHTVEWGDDMLLITRRYFVLPTGYAIFTEKVESLMNNNVPKTYVFTNTLAMDRVDGALSSISNEWF